MKRRCAKQPLTPETSLGGSLAVRAHGGREGGREVHKANVLEQMPLHASQKWMSWSYAGAERTDRLIRAAAAADLEEKV